MSAGSGLLARAAAATGDDCIGLHLAEHADLRTVDVHFYAMTASATLRDAFERLSRYQRLIHETSRIELSTTPDGMILRHVLPGGLTASRQTAEFLLAAWVRSGRLITGSHWCPLEVRFAHTAGANTDEHRRFFQSPVRFGAGENSVTVPASSLTLSCIGADPALASFMDRYAGERMPPHPPGVPAFADRVREAVIAALRDGDAGATAVAARMKMSVRTLNRTLAAEGTTFRVVLDRLRAEIACRHLADPRTSIAEVAFLVGFSELSAFSRAFKRWTGQAPARFRADRAHAGGAIEQ